MCFANWIKPLKLTAVSALLFLFSFAQDDGTPAKTSATPTESCSAALRVFDKLSSTLSVQSVSLSNTPSEAFAEQRGGTPRGPVPSSHLGRGLPVRILLLSKKRARY